MAVSQKAIYEFSVFVKIVEKVDCPCTLLEVPPEFPPAAFPSLSIFLLRYRFSLAVIEGISVILKQIGLEVTQQEM